MSASPSTLARQSRRLAGAATSCSHPKSGFRSQIATRRSASSKGRGASKTARTPLKIVVVAPMPKASTRTAVTVKPGLRIRVRPPTRTSHTQPSTPEVDGSGPPGEVEPARATPRGRRPTIAARRAPAPSRIRCASSVTAPRPLAARSRSTAVSSHSSP